MKLIDLIHYHPYNEQESRDLELIKSFINRNTDILKRSNLAGHLTSSALIMNNDFTKVLFIHHNIYNSWGWIGGHNDGEEDCLKEALKEAKEETGVSRIEPFSDEILGLDVIYVNNHHKNGNYVSDHLHLNVTFLLIADERDSLTVKPDENSDVKWFDIEDVLNHISEPRMVPIYKKLIHKALFWKKQKN